MNIAVVLYGQPRDYIKGYNNIMAFIQKQSDCKFDFFYHTWKLNENEIYKHSPWRQLDNDTLIYNNNIINNLQELYNPILVEIENQNDITFDKSLYINTLAYNNTTEEAIFNNINNILFQMYSRNKARNLLQTYLNNHNNIYYDFVLFVRFDIGIMPELSFNELNKSNVYVSDLHCPRKVLPDNCIISPTKIFLEWFNIYDMLSDILNNEYLQQNISDLNENFIINAESLILAKYIYHYKNIDNISYFNGGLL